MPKDRHGKPAHEAAADDPTIDRHESPATQTEGSSAEEQAGGELWQLPGDRYQVVGEIARGGMGVVLRAVDTDVQRPLAVKVMLSSPTKAQQQRFLDEARITGQLQHPGIPPVHEIGRLADGLPFFSMKLIEGHTLTQLLQGRETPQTDLPRFLMIFEQIAQTVAYAHSGGIIHRDLKPDNVMVGAFGEVQVMDWGLAKWLSAAQRLESDSHQQAVRDSTPVGPFDATVQHHPRTGNTDERTQAGEIMGTLAYMPPEQALGKVDWLDQRSDVFGLGAILCEILTGKPPYIARDRARLYQLAGEARLERCFTRLDACGADQQLLDLTRSCLAARPADRPRDAGVVSRVVTAYLETVQQRLKEAEIQRAEAQARAAEEQKLVAEERKRRQAEQAKAHAERQKHRLMLAASGLVVLLLTGLVLGITWYARTQAQQARQEAATKAAEARRKNERAVEQAARDARRGQLNEGVSNALQLAGRMREDLHERLVDSQGVHVFLSDIDEWERAIARARNAWNRAHALAQSNPQGLRTELADRLRELDRILKADKKEFELAEKLDTIRHNTMLATRGEWSPASAVAEFPAVFREAGCDVENGKIADAARDIRDSPIRYALVAALDHWAQFGNSARFLAIARKADPDPWRDRLRQEETWDDSQALEQLAAEIDLRQQSPQTINMLASRLHRAGSDPLPLLRKAIVQYRRDYNLFFDLGIMATDHQEKIGSYRAALAVRPDSTAALCNLSNSLMETGDLEGAIDNCRKGLAIDSRFVFLHVNMGNFLWKNGDLDGAVASYQNALEIDPDFPPARAALREALSAKGDPPAAVREAQRLIDADPDSHNGHFRLGRVLLQNGDWQGAVTHLQIAADIAPDDAPTHYNLGRALKELSDWDRAAASYKQAIACDPQYAEAHCNLAYVLKRQGKLVEALQMVQRGHELGSNRTTWKYPSDQWVARARRRVELEKKLPAIIRGNETPADAGERAGIAEVLGYKKRYADAARFYDGAFQEDPAIADDLNVGHRYNAARNMVLAVAEEKVGELSNEERQAWREQARAWLREDIQAWTTRLKRFPQTASSIKRQLRSWQIDPDLAPVRDAVWLDKLSPEAQTAWRQLWADVAALIRRIDPSQE